MAPRTFAAWLTPRLPSRALGAAQELNHKLRAIHLRDDALEERCAWLEAQLAAERESTSALKRALAARDGALQRCAGEGEGDASSPVPTQSLVASECHASARFAPAVVGVGPGSAIELGVLAGSVTAANFVGLRAVTELPAKTRQGQGQGMLGAERSTSLGRAFSRRVSSSSGSVGSEGELLAGCSGAALLSAVASGGGVELGQGLPPDTAAFEIMWKEESARGGAGGQRTPVLRRATVVADQAVVAQVRARVDAWSESTMLREVAVPPPEQPQPQPQPQPPPGIASAVAIAASTLGLNGHRHRGRADVADNGACADTEGAEASEEWVAIDGDGTEAAACAAESRDPDTAAASSPLPAEVGATSDAQGGDGDHVAPPAPGKKHSLLGSTRKELVAPENAGLPPGAEGSSIMSAAQVAALHAALPPFLKLCSWELLYSTRQHGISLQTLLRRNTEPGGRGHGACITVVRDMGGAVFGCFTSERWHACTRYYGDGQGFVFQLHPRCEAFLWTRRNNYFQLVGEDSVACGGGGAWALWLDGELSHGNSGYCETFGCGCLASSESFQVQHVEVWGFVDGY